MTTNTREAAGLNPICVATTGDTFASKTSNFHDGRERKARLSDPVEQPYSQAFRGAQFSADGTCIVTHHADQHLRTFLLPEDLLRDSDGLQSLDAYCSIPSATPISSYALYPKFSLQDPATTVAAYASKDLPIRLVNALYSDVIHAKYPLVSPTTEEYIKASGLTWTRHGDRLLAGSENQISIFDTSYDGYGPIAKHKLAHGKHGRKQYGQTDTCRGIVSAMSISANGILAIGTFQRNIALFANEGASECIASLALPSAQGEHDSCGKGITNVAWSPSGAYLLIAERQSDCIQVYDVRNTFQRLSCLRGRNAHTFQRLNIDVVPTAEGFEVWAGGKDGCVRMWENPGSAQGEQQPSFASELHQDPVSSAIWHPQGAVLATCTGRDFKNHKFLDTDSNEPDDVLKIWTM